MTISLIAAVDSKNGIGLNGIMPWGHIKEDMEFLKKRLLAFPLLWEELLLNLLKIKLCQIEKI